MSGNSIWNYFEKCDDDESRATCKFCNERYCYKSTTHNLKCHLAKKHPKVLEEMPLPPCRPARSAPTLKIKQKAIWAYFTHVKGSDKIASCIFCNKLLSYRTTITNLKTHLKRVHDDAYDRMLQMAQSQEDNIEEVYLEYEEDSNQSEEAALESTLWSYFERKGTQARCVVCRNELPPVPEDLKAHLEENHPKLLNDTAQESENENADEDYGETEDAEIVFVDSVQGEKKSTYIRPVKIKNVTTKPRQSKRAQRSNSASSDEYSTKRKKTDEKDEELEKFGQYISCLLKAIPHNECMKLQVDIVSLIMKTKLKCQSDLPEAGRNVILDSAPITIQAVGAVAGTGIVLAVPNTDISKKDTDAESPAPVQLEGTEVLDAESASVPSSFSSNGYSFTVSSKKPDVKQQ